MVKVYNRTIIFIHFKQYLLNYLLLRMFFCWMVHVGSCWRRNYIKLSNSCYWGWEYRYWSECCVKRRRWCCEKTNARRGRYPQTALDSNVKILFWCFLREIPVSLNIKSHRNSCVTKHNILSKFVCHYLTLNLI